MDIDLLHHRLEVILEEINSAVAQRIADVLVSLFDQLVNIISCHQSAIQLVLGRVPTHHDRDWCVGVLSN